MKTDRELETNLSRRAYYGLTREYLNKLMLLVPTKSERKGLEAIYALLAFLQGGRRFPKKNEIHRVISSVLDRNLSQEEFADEWGMNWNPDLAIDDPETYFLEQLEKLELIRRLKEGWSTWTDGT